MENNRTASLSEQQPNQVIQSRLHDSSPSKGPTVRYGLPCRNCKAYYAANVIGCPYCGCIERALAVATNVSQPAAAIKEELRSLQAEISGANSQAKPEEPGDRARLDEDRERVLPEYKTQIYADHPQINPVVSFQCNVENNHRNGDEPAMVCKSCYTHVTERLQQIEAALCIDVREAAQIIYDAVWSDPSPGDPSRTYKNAAAAVLSEIHRRSNHGLLGPFAPHGH